MRLLAYKQRRTIINYAYQTAADNVVGKMTVRRLDEELRLVQDVPTRSFV